MSEAADVIERADKVIEKLILLRNKIEEKEKQEEEEKNS